MACLHELGALRLQTAAPEYAAAPRDRRERLFVSLFTQHFSMRHNKLCDNKKKKKENSWRVQKGWTKGTSEQVLQAVGVRRSEVEKEFVPKDRERQAESRKQTNEQTTSVTRRWSET